MLASTRFVRLAATFSLATLVAGCGGGSSSPAAPASTATTYTASAVAGELLTYTVDTTKLTYGYTITDSQFGLTGKTGSGTLTVNSDGTYSPSGMINARIVILPDGLMLGAIRESFNGIVTTVPVIGMSNPVTSLSVGQGTYNFVQRSCLSGACSSAYGTFVIKQDSTWTACPGGNMMTGCMMSTHSGTLNPLGDGKWQVMDGATDMGTALVFNSSGQNVVVLDLKDIRVGGYGIGILVGSSQQSMNPSQTNGTWWAAATNGNWATFTASGSQINYMTIDGLPATLTTMFTADSPWMGLATAAGGHALLAGTGVYAYAGAGGYAEIGVKFH